MTGTGLQYHTQIRANWGHCDPAEIIYYPNYFEWFDECFHGLLATAGFDQRNLRERFKMVGTGAVNANGQFHKAVTYGDVLDATSYVEKWSERSFTVYHRFDSAGVLAVEGREVRLWLVRDGDSETSIDAAPIPEEFKQCFSWTD
ncbi:MAG: 4-hydroxybenzoyl-CoA thioesterase [Gammaproteobacteria bacterium]|jgi:4-hydroxybenzoyl-CoA thioesterase